MVHVHMQAVCLGAVLGMERWRFLFGFGIHDSQTMGFFFLIWFGDTVVLLAAGVLRRRGLRAGVGVVWLAGWLDVADDAQFWGWGPRGMRTMLLLS